jgi:hypothetical protein
MASAAAAVEVLLHGEGLKEALNAVDDTVGAEHHVWARDGGVAHAHASCAIERGGELLAGERGVGGGRPGVGGEVRGEDMVEQQRLNSGSRSRSSTSFHGAKMVTLCLPTVSSSHPPLLPLRLELTPPPPRHRCRTRGGQYGFLQRRVLGRSLPRQEQEEEEKGTVHRRAHPYTRQASAPSRLVLPPPPLDPGLSCSSTSSPLLN